MNFETWQMVDKLERDMRNRRADRLKKLGPLPERRRGRPVRFSPRELVRLVNHVWPRAVPRPEDHGEGGGRREPAHTA